MSAHSHAYASVFGTNRGDRATYPMQGKPHKHKTGAFDFCERCGAYICQDCGELLPA